MNHEQQSELLFSAIQDLMALYADICGKISKLQMIDLSDLKK